MLFRSEEMNFQLGKIASTVFDRLERLGLKGKTITLKIKYGDFKQVTRSQSFAEVVEDEEQLAATARQLLAAVDPEDKKIRLLGISISNFSETRITQKKEGIRDQLKLF